MGYISAVALAVADFIERHLTFRASYMSDKILERELSLFCQELIQAGAEPTGHLRAIEILSSYLKQLDFSCEIIRSTACSNLWATNDPKAQQFIFAGHTDVVPPGPLDKWSVEPFKGSINNGIIIGRGAVDMRSAIAAFAVAAKLFLQSQPKPNFGIGFVIAGDEETAANGTEEILNLLNNRGIKIDFALVGEPTSEHDIGDTLKVGRRGSVSAKVRIHGKQGHSAYPDKIINPLEKSLTALLALSKPPFPNTLPGWPENSLQITALNTNAGTAGNATPSYFDLNFNCRFSPQYKRDDIIKLVEAELTKTGLRFEAEWSRGCHPFYCKPGVFCTRVSAAIHAITGAVPELSCSGGTSDARFFADKGIETVEFGLCSEMAHQIDEQVEISSIVKLSQIYLRILEMT